MNNTQGEDNGNESIQKIIAAGAEITGSVSGAVVSLLIADAPGVILGAASGSLFSTVLKTAAVEMCKRFLGKREAARIGAAYTYAVSKISENLESGMIIRSDNFFGPQKNNRSSAEELLEGILLAAQKTYEERKVKFLGSLYANIAFDTTIDTSWANFYIQVCQSLSYRQLCLIAIYNDAAKYHLDKYVDFFERAPAPVIRIDVLSELYDLRDKGIVDVLMPNMMGSQPSRSSTFPPELVKIAYHGKKLFELMNLKELDQDDIYEAGERIGIRRN